jgi:hypothetical protein
MASTLLCSQLLLVVLVVVYLVVYGYVTDNSGVGECSKMGLFHPHVKRISSWRRTSCFTNSL